MLRKLKKVLGLTFLNRDQRRYLQFLHNTDPDIGFDATHYQATHTDLNPVVLRWPHRHFVVYGEAEGRSPRPGFLPVAYQRMHEAVAESGLAPFEHWLTTGRDDERFTAQHYRPETGAFPDIADGAPGQQHPWAIVAHLYFLDLWPEMADALKGTNLDHDLHITLTTGPEAEVLRQHILDTFPAAHVVILPNRGRDVLPFVLLANAGLLDGYRAVCKIHGKRSLHRTDGDQWRTSLLSALLPADTTGLAKRFLASGAALATADDYVFTEPTTAANADQVTHLRTKQRSAPNQPEPEPPAHVSFAAGSMFWATPQLIAAVKDLALAVSDFPDEAGQLDGTLAHGFERYLGELATPLGGVRGLHQL